MAKKNKNKGYEVPQVQEQKAESRRSASLRHMTHSGPVPIEPVATNIQLTPIVQPLAFVPYSSQKQKLFVEHDEEYLDYGDDEAVAEVSNVYNNKPSKAVKSQGEVKAKRKGVNGVSIFLLVFSLVIIAAMVVGKFVLETEKYLAFTVNEGNVFVVAYSHIEALIENIKNDISIDSRNVIPAITVLVAFFVLLTFFASFGRMKKRGASIFAKITTALSLVFVAVLVALHITNEIEIGYGLYGVAALLFVQTVVVYLVPRK